MRKFVIYLAVWFIVSGKTLLSQHMEFGSVPVEDLKMEVYELDSTASAVILFDVGKAELDPNLKMEMKRHVRIKILTDEGVKYGDFVQNYSFDDPREKVGGIKAQTYNLEDGEIKVTKLNKRDILNDKDGEHYGTVKFTMPALKAGSVIEYEYTLKSESPTLPDWEFQSSIPTRWSEYKARVPEWFTYLKVMRGYEPTVINKQDVYNGYGRIPHTGTEYHWALKDIPAIHQEPYMKAIGNYRSAIRFQLSSIYVPGYINEQILEDWPKVAGALIGSKYHGGMLEKNNFLKDIVEQLIDKDDSQLEKIRKIYDHVSKHMTWNEVNSIFASQSSKDSYEKGNGNSADINLLLGNMLRKAGIETYSVVLSTTDHGDIIRSFPLASQFNHTIVVAIVDGEDYFLDAKNEYRPYTLLPASCLNSTGLMLNDQKGGLSRWVEIKNKEKNKVSYFAQLKLDSLGNLSGKLNTKSTGLIAYNQRMEVDRDEITSSVHDLFFDEPDNVSVDSVSITSLDIAEGLNFDTHFSIDRTSGGDVIYLNPLFFDQLESNPFIKEDRKFPIDFDYPFSRSITLTFEIPEEYNVEELPEQTAFRLPDNSGIYSRIMQVQGNMIMMRHNFEIKKFRYLQNDYATLRHFFELVVNSSKEQIVLKKKA